MDPQIIPPTADVTAGIEDLALDPAGTGSNGGPFRGDGDEDFDQMVDGIKADQNSYTAEHACRYVFPYLQSYSYKTLTLKGIELINLCQLLRYP